MASIDDQQPVTKHVYEYRREVREIRTSTTTTMATTSKDPMSASIQFPGQPVYVRTGEDVESPAHREHIEKWIQDYEKNRPVFVFPSVPVRRFGIMILILSLASLLLQIGSATAKYAFAASLLGNGIWIAVICAAAGIIGIAAADQLSINLLYYFKALTAFASVLSAALILMYSSGIDAYTKQCYKEMPPTKENIKEDMNSTSLADNPNAPLHWTGQCDQSSVVLMSLALMIHALIMFMSLAASVYVMKVLNSPNFSSNRGPPLVIYHSDTMEMKSTAPLQGTSAGAVRITPTVAVSPGVTAAGVGVEKMIERLQGQEPTVFTTAAAH